VGIAACAQYANNSDDSGGDDRDDDGEDAEVDEDNVREEDDDKTVLEGEDAHSEGSKTFLEEPTDAMQEEAGGGMDAMNVVMDDAQIAAKLQLGEYEVAEPMVVCEVSC
jgi:hypothetical protein